MSFRATKKNKNESYLEVDLDKLFGKQVPDSEALKQAVGQEIIDTIQSRTEDGKFISNERDSYSKEYADTLEFKVSGKSKNDVNLKQSGDMLNTMTITKTGKSSVRIGWDDSEEAAKATNHNFGITVPRRQFLGLTGEESSEIASKMKDRLKASEELNASQKTSAVDPLTSLVLREFALDPEPAQEVASVSIFRSLFNNLGLGNNGES